MVNRPSTVVTPPPRWQTDGRTATVIRDVKPLETEKASTESKAHLALAMFPADVPAGFLPRLQTAVVGFDGHSSLVGIRGESYAGDRADRGA